MISINQVSVLFGGFALFNDISFMINPRDRIGLTGKNGAGKSTLLKLIHGEDKPTTGKINIPPGITLGYLPQQMNYTDTTTVWEETIKAFERVQKLQKEIKTLENEIAHRIDYESDTYMTLIEQLAEANEQFDILGGNSLDADAERTLIGLGFKRTDFSRLTSEFSGGWRMRIELIKILLLRPSVLLLDEPTNHLDIESIQWLEEFLKDYPGALVLVSHDRTFLDTVTNRTVEISMGKVYDYKVSYSEYVELRKERLAHQLASYTNQQKIIEDTEKFIERFRYKATKAVQVQSRIKQLDKIERIEIDEIDNSSINIRFPAAPRSGTIVVETENLSKSYGKLEVLKDTQMIIERGEKVAFVGRNGEGKTTMARIIMDELDYSGVYKLGHNVSIGYFAQNQAQLLDENKTVFQTIDDVAVGDIRTKIRDILGAFLFSGETIDKKVMVLSGGERSRLALAKLLLEPYSLLVLDEPTNHLDMQSKDVLKNALLKYDGTLILVSHDRYFLNGLVNKVYEYKDKHIFEHLGGIYDFLQKRKLATLKEIEIKEKIIQQQKEEEKPSDNKLSSLKRKELEKEARKIQNKINKSEHEIARLEAELQAADNKLAQPDTITDDNFYSTYENIKKQLNIELENWEILNNELEEWNKNNNL